MPLPQGGLPPSLSPAPANSGPAVAAQGNQGNSALAMIDVQNAVKMLEKALPMIPMASKLHTTVLNAAKDLAKELSAGDENQGLNIQSLLQMARSASQAAPLSALSRMAQGPANAPPAMPGQASPPPPSPALPQAA